VLASRARQTVHMQGFPAYKEKGPSGARYQRVTSNATHTAVQTLQLAAVYKQKIVDYISYHAGTAVRPIRGRRQRAQDAAARSKQVNGVGPKV
jgi:hypothetical protein